MVLCLYHAAIHYLDSEYQNVYDCKNIDIQTMVETPKIYIVARSGSSDVEQLTYVDTRLESLKDLTMSKLVLGIKSEIKCASSAVIVLHANSNRDNKKGETSIVLDVVQMHNRHISWTFAILATTCHYLIANSWYSPDLLVEKILWQKLPNRFTT